MPPWLDASSLSGVEWYGPPQSALTKAAELATLEAQFQVALRPAGDDLRMRILAELKLRTVSRDESPDEARARFRLLRNDLSDVPADILRKAVDAFVNAPGSKFMPTAGELRTHAGPLLSERRVQLYRIGQTRMAAEAHKPAPTETVDPEAIDAIMREFGIARSAAPVKAPRTFHQPTAAEVQALAPAEKIGGLSPAIEAMRAKWRGQDREAA